ncbi:MAG: 50S ribosomal protein L11 methyltransferase [Desulfosudaceae bacterium]
MRADAAIKTTPPATDDKPPYDRLVIYYLKGKAGDGPFPFGDHFIGNWEEEDSSFLFFSRAADNEVKRFVRQQSHLDMADIFHMTYEEWQSLDSFPLVTGGWCLYPPWFSHPGPATGGNRPVLLDPGVVFGSGLHPTTRDCLEAMDLLLRQHDREINSALDIGTGTGLLAVCAALSGIRQVIGMDLNFLAARTADRNVLLNGVEQQVMIVKGDAGNFATAPTDLLIANIHYDIMRHLIVSDAFIACKYFIISGLLRTPARRIQEQLAELPVKIIKKWNAEQIWCTILGKVL